jgi:hypothetical protein
MAMSCSITRPYSYRDRVRSRNARSKEQLRQFILEEWDKITNEEINALILTMPGLTISCKNREGFSDPY